MAGPREALALGALLASIAAATQAQTFTIVGACRSGQPNGAYELRMEDGRLRVVGAFSHGRKTGTFIFWTESGARVAVIPYDEDARSGTIALWYTAPDGRMEAGRKLEAPYVDDRLHGVVRSWHASGAPRAEYRYERGELTEARAWTEAGAELSDGEARSLALRDAEADRQFCDALLAVIQDHLPPCV
jgi:hypothetical protein